MPVKILCSGRNFPTKTSFEAYVKDLIYNKIGVCTDVEKKHPEHFQFLMDFLSRHPDFTSKITGMERIDIQKNALGNGNEIIIVKQPLNECISWKIALNGKVPCADADLIQSLRNVVSEQVIAFRKDSPEQKCEMCSSDDKLEVDHIHHFHKLSTDFLSTRNYRPSKFSKMTDGTNRVCFHSSDKEFEDAWKEYHFKSATLRLLCRGCNSKRGKKD